MNRSISRCAGATCALLTCLVALPASAQTITADNEDGSPTFSVLYGTWNNGSYGQPNGTNYHWATTTTYPSDPAAVEWRPSLPHGGAYHLSVWYVQGTNRSPNAPFTVHHAGGATTVYVNQQINGETWFPLGTYVFDAGTDGHVVLDNDASPNVVIADAIRFVAESTTAELTLAATPAGWGTTVPAPGPYTHFLYEVVPISAQAAPGYEFHHWEVSAGSQVAEPTHASTTVSVDQDKTVTAVFVEEQPVPAEFRGFWADAFHQGFKSVGEIETMISLALAGNYNAIIPEVLAFQDTAGGGHGAYWNSSIVPKATDIVGDIDPLYELTWRAHAAGLEVHCWLVAFRVSSVWPPADNPIVAAHPEWLMVPSGSIGTIAKVGSYYTFDAGSPGAQDYLMSIVRELGENYAIDGIHWDYIRYTQKDGGYPAVLSCPDSSLKRFQNITGYSGTPPYQNEPSWDDFRRRTISEFVRRAMYETATVPNPRQPLRHTAALVTWYPANINFHLTGAYGLFCDWEYWQEQGYLDATVPMCYFDDNSYPSTYRAWVDNSIFWADSYGRHTYIGPGIYMNTFAQSLTQMDYARTGGAHGFSTYSYTGTNDGGETWSDWYPYVATNLFTEPAPVPAMWWRDPALATEGFVYGRVTNGATGVPFDNATIQVDGVTAAQTDGNGCFLLTRLNAAGGGTTFAISASYTGYTQAQRPAVLVQRAGFTEANFALGTWLPGDYDVDADVDRDDLGYLIPALTGPGNGPPPAGGDIFDFDVDDDVDLPDFALFQATFTG